MPESDSDTNITLDLVAPAALTACVDAVAAMDKPVTVHTRYFAFVAIFADQVKRSHAMVTVSRRSSF